MARGETIIGLQWGMCLFTLLFVIFRIYVRVYKRSMWKWSDLFVIVAWCAFAFQASMDTGLYSVGFFTTDFYESQTVNGDEGLETLTAALKLIYIEDFTYYNCMYAVKASMLFFYFEIIPPLLPKTYYALWATVVITSVSWLYYILSVSLACQPVSSNWSLDPEVNCIAAKQNWALIPTLTLHAVTDVLIYLLPIPLLREMHNLSHAQRFGIGIIFGLGSVELAFGISCIFYRFFGNDVPTAWVLTIMEQTWAVVVVCLPAFKSFVARDMWDLIRRRRRRRTFDAVEIFASDDEKDKTSIEQRSRENSGGEGVNVSV